MPTHTCECNYGCDCDCDCGTVSLALISKVIPGIQGIAKRVPLGKFPGQSKGRKGMKAITLDMGNSLAAMHAFTF